VAAVVVVVVVFAPPLLALRVSSPLTPLTPTSPPQTKSNVDEIFLNISKALPAYVASNQPYNSLKLNAKQKSSGGCC
jgi:hypothetical protein